MVTPLAREYTIAPPLTTDRDAPTLFAASRSKAALVAVRFGSTAGRIGAAAAGIGSTGCSVGTDVVATALVDVADGVVADGAVADGVVADGVVVDGVVVDGVVLGVGLGDVVAGDVDMLGGEVVVAAIVVDVGTTTATVVSGAAVVGARVAVVDVGSGVVVVEAASGGADVVEAESDAVVSSVPHAATTIASGSVSAATRRTARPLTVVEGTWPRTGTVRGMLGRHRRRGATIVAALALALAGCSSGDNGASEPVELSEGPERLSYGDHEDAFGDLWLPVVEGERPESVPVVVLIHGGFWRDGFFLDLMNPLVPSLLDEGFAVWNIEYRRVGAGGGYPQTFDDVAAAIDELADLPERFDGVLDLDDVATVGHSAGGHLAVWLAGRGAVRSGSPGGDPVVLPSRVVAQAGVLDLVGCAEQGVGGTACTDLVGATPSADPERYEQTSPAEMIPIDADVVAVHGANDRIVPVTQSETYVDRAIEVGGRARLELIEGADHFSNLDPTHPAWLAVIGVLTS